MICLKLARAYRNFPVLDRLEKKKRIVRRQNPEDRRSSLVSLTEEGGQLRIEVISLFEGLCSELGMGIGNESQQVAVQVLEAIKTNIERSQINETV